MKGSTGVPMTIEYRPRKKGVHCKDCKYLKPRAGVIPYYCSIEKNAKKQGKYYTSIVKCKKYEPKEDNTTKIRVRKKNEEHSL